MAVVGGGGGRAPVGAGGCGLVGAVGVWCVVGGGRWWRWWRRWWWLVVAVAVVLCRVSVAAAPAAVL